MKKIMCKNSLAVKCVFLLDLIFQLFLNFSLHFFKGQNQKENKKSKEKIKCTIILPEGYLD